MPSREEAGGRATGKWLAVVGIGEDGAEGLSPRASALVAGAQVVFGGRRHLALAAALIRGEARPWPTPFDAAVAQVVALRGRPVCVLASGDPFHYGVGVTLARHVAREEMQVVPAPSAFSLAAARLGWALQAVETVSLHGRPVEGLVPFLHPGRRILALTSDGAGPGAIAALLAERGFGASRLHVLEALGGPRERVCSATAGTLGDAVFDPLNVVAVEVAGGGRAAAPPLGAGLDEALFEHDGQITKREIRALTLSTLAPRRGELLWDIGAGAGSVAIEWMLADPSMRAIAIEREGARAARIRRNALSLGVPGLEVVEGAAPAALEGLAPPDAIFIGGGGSQAGVAEAALAALRPGGRLVANAVTLEMEAALLALQARHGGHLTRIAVSRATPLGGMTGWRPAMPVTQWSWVKP
ncbi:precorrin-6y C5,15-methyltransferase (decarboxylating) subunit CbiE [Chelativorans intermedius]|uniref:Precorrin-6y C5,15-methyltransferase (Decarboxylating) subunit CbiE n=1 Tax=Chelativorans intermedius TaxID=515947 RepID=A0ABV6D5F3_9HYPH|nr:precorrin-6y C5,15-methyltransferase (decarboxylating) subunit CbiE [Chelativorans intermedius]MCT8997095.1 precorrin-6y C5,15-methyltransferase (decarboxylating) subunit CbiE [Chelativorans intermedius]